MWPPAPISSALPVDRPKGPIILSRLLQRRIRADFGEYWVRPFGQVGGSEPITILSQTCVLVGQLVASLSPQLSPHYLPPSLPSLYCILFKLSPCHCPEMFDFSPIPGTFPTCVPSPPAARKLMCPSLSVTRPPTLSSRAPQGSVSSSPSLHFLAPSHHYLLFSMETLDLGVKARLDKRGSWGWPVGMMWPSGVRSVCVGGGVVSRCVSGSGSTQVQSV